MTTVAHAPHGSPARDAFPELQNFSLVLGGPLYQFFRRAHLDDDVGTHVRRRTMIITGLIWLPLLILCAIDGTLTKGVEIPFVADVETHARFLVTVPLLIIAEYVVHKRMREIVAQFVERGLVSDVSIQRFRAAIRSAAAWRNSIPVELALVAAVFPLAYYRTDVLALTSSTWYATTGDATTMTMPGIWFTWVSNPIMQFLLLRWFYRLVIWARFLWQVSEIHLDLIPTHPDRNAGLGFLSGSAYIYTPLLAAMGTSAAGVVASRIFHEGASLADFRLEILAVVVIAMFLVVGPLLVFAPQIVEAKRVALREYGALATEYSRAFDTRWVRSPDRDGVPILGASDIQSLADLGNAYSVIREIKAVPFSRDMFVQLVVATVAPFFPLIFTMIPLDELLKRILGSVL